MATATSVAFVSLLQQHRLLEPAQLTEVEQTLVGRLPESKALARELVRIGWLTVYQVNQIGQGHAADLRLGNYVVLERLGEGGMGAVLKARHDKMHRVVALKVIRKERLSSPDAVKRFQREVRAAAQLNHANIVQAYDADEANGTHFLAMEFVDGIDLAKLVKESGPLPIQEACTYIRQAALGLQHAHEQGLVHRDIKPANLLLSSRSNDPSRTVPPEGPARLAGPSGVVKILDMGIARMSGADDDAHTLTKEGAVIGSLDYIAPEQALDSHSADIRADLYSLGCTGYFLLTGRVPFPGGEALAKLNKHQFEEPVPVEQLRPDVPPGVAGILRKLMAKRPEDRYRTPAEVADALDRLERDGCPPSEASVDTAERWAQAVDPSNTVALVRPQQRKAQRRLMLGVGVGGAVLLLALSAFAFLFWGNVRPTLPPPTPHETPSTPRADRELRLLLAKTKDPAVAPAQLREEVLDFCQKYRGLPACDRAAALLPNLPRLQNSIGMKLAPIPPGRFLMGSPENEPGRNRDGREGPQHEVEITRPFYMGVHEVTVGQFKAFVQDTGYLTEAETSGGATIRVADRRWANDSKASWQSPGFPQTDMHPVVCVSWNDATAFCAWLTKKEGKAYALPTEAQWEYCCRAGSQTKFGFGDNDDELAAHAWYLTNSGMRTHPVGRKKPNAWGLFDMLGNAREWTTDWDDTDYYKESPKQDPAGPSAGERRVLRGGAWNSQVTYCRAANRHGNPPSSRYDGHGFRVVLAR